MNLASNINNDSSLRVDATLPRMLRLDSIEDVRTRLDMTSSLVDRGDTLTRSMNDLQAEVNSLRNELANVRAESQARISNLEGLVYYLRDQIERRN